MMLSVEKDGEQWGLSLTVDDDIYIDVTALKTSLLSVKYEDMHVLKSCSATPSYKL